MIIWRRFAAIQTALALLAGLAHATPVAAWTHGQNLANGRSAPCIGLTDRGAGSWLGSYPTTAPPNNFTEVNLNPGLYRCVACSLRWLDMQPTQGAPIVTAPLDACIALRNAYNAANPSTPIDLKLRFFGGQNAPAWAMALDGGPLSWHDGYQTGLWWMADYRAYWKAFLTAVAAQYNGNPAIRSIAMTSGNVGTAEPFLVPVGTIDIAMLAGVGYTDAAELAVMRGTADDYAAWTAPALETVFNNFEITVNGNSTDTSPALDGEIMATRRQNFGTTGEVGQHSMRAVLLPKNATLYAYIAAIGAPVEFQYDTPTDENGDTTCALGDPYHQRELEIADGVTAGGYNTWTSAQKHACSAKLGGYP